MKRTFTLLTGILFVFPAFAWNHTGHKVVAELCWRGLSSGERKGVGNLLKQHPHYALLLATNVPVGRDTNEWAFLNAAVWPDMVRPARSEDREKPVEITKYHRSPWHYINIPYVWPPDSTRISASSFAIPTTNILWALSNQLEALRDLRAPAPDRAVSLCWVLHLVGDLHQPLHAATMLSEKFPKGDMGGNSVGVHDGSVPLNLHSFWDQILGDCDSYEGIGLLSQAMAAASEYRRMPEYKHSRTIRSWADESFAAAAAFAYDEGHLRFVENREAQSGKIAAADIPRLKATYILNAKDVSRRRISLAGKRLTDLLKPIF
jgi:S1/P1 Nuclease